MSFIAQACSHLASQAQHSTRPPQGQPPAHYQAHGRLYRAIVSLPPSMCERDRPLQERWVFFDCPNREMPHARIEALLALAWNIDTTAWCSNGLIYSIGSASDLIAQGDADDDTALFECAWGGPDGTQHVSPHDVDYFCTPRVRARLELALMQARVGPALKASATMAERLSSEELLAMRVLKASPGQRLLHVRAHLPGHTKPTVIRVDADQYKGARRAKAANVESEGGAA